MAVDGVHPIADGYAAMERVLDPVVQQLIGALGAPICLDHPMRDRYKMEGEFILLKGLVGVRMVYATSEWCRHSLVCDEMLRLVLYTPELRSSDVSEFNCLRCSSDHHFFG
ncbi:MAG TPA: hypothetical protein VFT56_17615 [Sphingomonas sp.]|nr:hypothetical protein [Sphingomonas sp.]